MRLARPICMDLRISLRKIRAYDFQPLAPDPPNLNSKEKALATF
jgi:hypothetical protein